MLACRAPSPSSPALQAGDASPSTIMMQRSAVCSVLSTLKDSGCRAFRSAVCLPLLEAFLVEAREPDNPRLRRRREELGKAPQPVPFDSHRLDPRWVPKALLIDRRDIPRTRAGRLRPSGNPSPGSDPGRTISRTHRLTHHRPRSPTHRHRRASLPCRHVRLSHLTAVNQPVHTHHTDTGTLHQRPRCREPDSPLGLATQSRAPELRSVSLKCYQQAIMELYTT